MNDLAQLEFSSRDGCCIATCTGEIDISNVDDIRVLLNAHLDRALPVVIDLTATTYLDSAGVHLIFGLAERLKVRRQPLRLVVPPDALISRVLELSDLVGHVTIHADLSDALGRPTS